MTREQKVSIWREINRYVETCGGDPSGRVYGAISRQEAVANVEKVLDDIECSAKGNTDIFGHYIG